MGICKGCDKKLNGMTIMRIATGVVMMIRGCVKISFGG